MAIRFIRYAMLLITGLLASTVVGQAQQPTTNAFTARFNTTKAEFRFADLLARAPSVKRAGFSLMPQASNAGTTVPVFTITPMVAAAANLQVVGGGTLGRLTKWSGFTGSNSVIGNSTIFEDKFGMVGIGTDSPVSRLTVAGMIQSLGGGFKFPDGTIQATAATSGLQLVSHDATLVGDGTSGAPLGVAVPLTLIGSAANSFAGVIRSRNSSDTQGIGVRGESINGTGVAGYSQNAPGVIGIGGTSGEGVSVSFAAPIGVLGVSFQSSGIVGESKSDNIDDAAVKAFGQKGGAFAGIFIGNVAIRKIPVPDPPGDGNLEVAGNLNVMGGSKNFKIDHPLDPENKYLYHAAIESSEVLNIYSGNVATDINGDVTVTLPDWFEALNRDFRYQLTVIGTFAQAIVTKKIKNNRFIIKTNAPNVEVSWQVMGVRSDVVMQKHPFNVEEKKAEGERGYYLNPDAYDLPVEKSIEWARNPEMIRQMREIKQKQRPQQ